MANQPPVRPWFRLASLRPLPAAPPPAPAPPPEPQPPPPAPAPVTRPIMSLPTFRTTSAPSSPQTRPAQPPAPPEPAPLPPPAPEPIAPRAAEAPSPARKVPSPPPPVQKAEISVPSSIPSNNVSTQSPKTIRPADQSPKVKKPSAAAPPSPLKTIDKPKQIRNNNNGMSDEKGKISHHEKSAKKKAEESGGGGFRVITIAGENRGAFMEVIQSTQKGGHKKSIATPESGKSSEEEGDGKEKKKKKEKNGRGRSETTSFPMMAFVNSNVQSVNNSLLYNASCSHHDPGVRFSLTKKPLGLGDHVKKEESN
ncbi:vegetative cell wall protein gp1-like [Senna tora]|uniref:Vegetative cell wall protein gp1-like n=1 Tax=Senna tora TaxID=362788 RepID=A0A834WKG3_9FABA|nr:vegetative cell wall protein gp1-like [Senna tora]